MAKVKFEKEITALLVVDPYNDFISEGGKSWDRIRAVAEANDCVPHMLQVLNAARNAKLPVFYALHHRYRPGDYETWKYVAPIQKAAWLRKTFEAGTWGGEIRPEFEPKPGEIVATEHWCSSGLRQHRLRFAAQEARHSSAYCHRSHSTHLHRSDRSLCRGVWLRGDGGKRCDGGLLERVDARRSRLNIPNYASVVTTKEVVESISSL